MIYSWANTLGTTTPLKIYRPALSVLSAVPTAAPKQPEQHVNRHRKASCKTTTTKEINGCCRCFFISEKNSEIDMPHLHIHFVSAGSEQGKIFRNHSQNQTTPLYFLGPISASPTRRIMPPNKRRPELWVAALAGVIPTQKRQRVLRPVGVWEIFSCLSTIPY